MIHVKRNLTTLLVVSLFIAVFSLPGAVSLAAVAVAPVAKPMSPVREGMLTPVRLALDPSGNYFYVSDARAQSILKYNVYGHLIKTIKTAGIPIGIALTGSGSNQRVVVTQGKYVSIYNPETGVEDGRVGVGIIGKANGVAIDPYNGTIFVTDGGKHQVHVFDSTGILQKSIGGYYGNANPPAGMFFNPTGIAYEKSAMQIAVADTNNGRIQFFSAVGPDYSPVKIVGLGEFNDARIDFVSPQGLSFQYDRNGNVYRLYVADTWKGGVQALDPINGIPNNAAGWPSSTVGTFLSLIGAGEISAGQFPMGILSGTADYQFLLPTDVQYDPVYRRLFVVSADSSIKILGIDGGKSPTDNSPINLTINASPLNVNTATYAISGTVKPGSDVKITTNTGATAGTVTYTGVAGRPTNWSATISGLALGSNKINVLATDVSGAELARDITVVYSLNAPALAVTTVNGIAITANSAVVKQLSNTLAGTVDAGCTVNITNNTTGISTTATVAAGTGTVAWSGTSLLSNNVANNFTVTASKTGSNTASANVTIIADTTSPLLHISTLPDSSYLSGSGAAALNVSGYVQDVNPATVSVSANGVLVRTDPTPLPAASFSVSVPLQTGANIVTVTATDLAGNTSFTNTRTINYDSSRAQLSIASGPADNSFTKTASAAIGGTVTPANAVVTVTNNGVAVPGITNTSGAWNGTVSLVNGQNTIVVTATVGASDASVKRTVTLDGAKPTVAITSPATDVAINNPSMQIVGTVSGGADGYPVLLAATVGATSVTPTSYVNGTFTYDISANLVAESSNQFTLTATDSAGNVSDPARLNITYDTIQPALTVDQTSSANPKTIGGTVENFANITVKDGDTTFPVTITYPRWTADLSSADYNRDTLQIKAVDVALNTRVLGLNYSRPTGDIDGGGVTVNDALRALQFAVGSATPTAAELKAGDIGPLLKGAANPDGRIDVTDAILILRKAVDPAFSW